MTIDEEVAAAADEVDTGFDALQPAMVADLRARGVTDDQMREVLAYAHGEFWRARCDLLARFRTALERINGLHP
jgi:hypothetical protein